jgi:hypothetical protein
VPLGVRRHVRVHDRNDVLVMHEKRARKRRHCLSEKGLWQRRVLQQLSPDVLASAPALSVLAPAPVPKTSTWPCGP